MSFRRVSLAASLVLSAVLAAACGGGGDALIPPFSPTAGLNNFAGTDSAGNPLPPVPPGESNGYFTGTVLGPSAPGAGNDSLATAPRVVGARITAYPALSPAGAAGPLGPAVVEMFTDAQGRFTLPPLQGGLYVVTITPPTGSPYGGVWVTAHAHSGSHLHPWWVVLWTR